MVIQNYVLMTNGIGFCGSMIYHSNIYDYIISAID
jgi:hypothetical protein